MNILIHQAELTEAHKSRDLAVEENRQLQEANFKSSKNKVAMVQVRNSLQTVTWL